VRFKSANIFDEYLDKSEHGSLEKGRVILWDLLITTVTLIVTL
jgi:hypothetical protein